MQLETYISDLLYRYDCVTIPGFGAFLSQRVSAKIHESTHTFYPPKKVLSFNEQLQNNDGLLANYIAEAEAIPFAVAVEKIAKYVTTLRAQLVTGQTVMFQNIGALTLNNNHKISFEPSVHINYLTDAFGLSYFSAQKLQRDIHKENVTTIERNVPIAITSEKRANTNWLKYAAVAVIVLGLSGVVGANYYKTQIEQQNLVAEASAKEEIETKVQEATFVISNPLPTATFAIEKQTGNYHIVAGAFRVEANSDKKVQQLRAMGYKARKIGVNRFGLYQVVYSSYDSRSEAQHAMFNIRRTHNNAAWLLVKDLSK